MCLAQVAQVVEVRGDGTAVVDDAGRRCTVSLAALVLDGVEVSAGDWLVAQTGLAVERLHAEVATALLAERSVLEEGA